MNQELQEKLDLYRKQLDKLFRTSRLLSSDSKEEKERIYGMLRPPCDRLPLYRYYKLDAEGYVLSALRHGKVTVSNPKIFNDPFDSLLYVDREKVRAAQQLYPPERIINEVNPIRAGNPPSLELNGVIQEFFIRLASLPEEDVKKALSCSPLQIEKNTSLLIDNVIAYLRGLLRIACFSERCDSPLMWAHYADCGRGICVEYDVPTTGEIAHPIKGLSSDRDCFLSMFPVVYSTDRYDATHIAEDLILLLLAVEIGAVNSCDFSKYDLLKDLKLSLYKSNDWEYEREWRLFTWPYLPTDPERLFIDKPLMTSVILGHSMVEVQKESVLEALRTYKMGSGNMVKIKRMVVDSSSSNYTLRIEDCGEI
jgi:hypothetical protein